MKAKKVKIGVKSITTKFGTAKISNGGYWRITSGKEENIRKYLHRLMFEDFHKCSLLPCAVIHHKDGDKLNNRYDNLQLISRENHSQFHNSGENNPLYGKPRSEETKRKISENHARYWKGKTHSEETKRKMSESHTGKNLSEETKMKLSESQNTSGYYRVSKHKYKNCKQGFSWRYRYYGENGKKKSIESVDIEKLEKKVKERGLKWKKFEEEV